MNLYSLKNAVVVAALSAASAFAGPSVIGVASASGTFTVDNSQVRGNSNLVNGSQIATQGTVGEIYLQGGPSATLAANAGARVYGDHLELTQGAVRVDNLNRFAVKAMGCNIVPERPGSEATVRMLNGSVDVAGMEGSLKVYNAQGALMRRVEAGTAYNFDSCGDVAMNMAPQNSSDAAAQSGGASSGAGAAGGAQAGGGAVPVVTGGGAAGGHAVLYTVVIASVVAAGAGAAAYVITNSSSR